MILVPAIRIQATAGPELGQRNDPVAMDSHKAYVHTRHRRVRRAGTSWTCTEAEKITDLCTAAWYKL